MHTLPEVAGVFADRQDIQRQIRLWFDDQALSETELADRLKQHSLLHILLAGTDDEILPWSEIIDRLVRFDPTLADPSVNPQAASNQRLRTVQLLLYQESSLGMPLVEVPGGALEEESTDDANR